MEWGDECPSDQTEGDTSSRSFLLSSCSVCSRRQRNVNGLTKATLQPLSQAFHLRLLWHAEQGREAADFALRPIALARACKVPMQKRPAGLGKGACLWQSADHLVGEAVGRFKE